MQNDKTFLEKEPVKRLLFRLALPTVIAQLVNMLYNIIDRIYIGHMPGDGAMALTGVGYSAARTSLTALNRPPCRLCSSTVRMTPPGR